MTLTTFRDFQRIAVAPKSVAPAGNYTDPKTWGVYRLPADNGNTGMTYRLGNHPVRHLELVRDYGRAELVLLFTARETALDLRDRLNNGMADLSVGTRG